MHLTAAYRSLSRPSSADIAKASAVRPYLLDLLFFLRFVKSLFFSKKRYFFVFYTVVKVRLRGWPLKTKQCFILCQNADLRIVRSLTLVFLPASIPRKEVIQPHLPIRLPCYDFTPIIAPTFDGWLLAVTSPASGVNDFRGVTGGVYKARERIHRSMLTCDY